MARYTRTGLVLPFRRTDSTTHVSPGAKGFRDRRMRCTSPLLVLPGGREPQNGHPSRY